MGAFKAYDIRGVYGTDFTADTIYRVGRELPELLGAECVLVGRDDRESSEEIYEALVRGITDAWTDVENIGLCTTPMTYYFTGSRGYDAAVMITASHNPKEYNGLKISRKGALPVGADSGLKDLERRVSGPARPPEERKGEVRNLDVRGEYVDFLKRNMPDLSGLKVVMDCSNGMAGLLARDVFSASKAEIEYMFEELDGTFPNHSPNPLEPAATEALRKRVLETGADIGVIFDGDADRVMFVNEKGDFVRPDLITAVLARYYLAMEPGSAVLCDIRTSRGVTEEILRCGGVPHLWKVGHAFAKIKMREINAITGGELAGHYYFRDFYCCDAAMLCSEIVLGVVARTVRGGGAFSGLVADFDIYSNSGECNYTIARKPEAIKALGEWAEGGVKPLRKYDFDGLRYEWADWWFNIRPSNTEPYLRLVAEAATPELLASKKAEIEKILEDFAHVKEKDNVVPEKANDVKVRQAVFADVRSIYTLIKENTDMLIGRSMSDVVQHVDRFMVAEAGGEVIGVIAFEILPEIGDITRTSIELQSVCVKKEWRRRGIGKMLVETQIERLRPMKAYQIVVLTFAEEFFAKLGFHIVPKGTLMHKLYMGCVNCTKYESPFTCPEKAMVLPLPQN